MTSDLGLQPGLRGVWVPLVTPFDADDRVDVASIERLCHEYLRAGARGIVALGTTGENTALDADEKREVVDVCSKVCAEVGAPLIVGTGTNSTRTTIAATVALTDAPGVVGALVVVPYYVRPSIEGVLAHYRAVAQRSPVPVIAYNIPYRTGRPLDAAALLELARIPNVVGVKQAVGALDTDTLTVLANAPETFHVLCGEDPYIYPIVMMGGVGAIAASSHLCTERFVAMVECGLAGKHEDGEAHAEALLPVVKAAFAEPNPAVFKGVLHAQGRISTPNLRLPMTNASPAAIDRCLEAIDAASRH
jgi:4-hydroxy-tetrahydrodipicolinate synthase